VARIKGTAMLSGIKFLRGFKERALELLPPGLHHYLKERIVVSGWYPEEDQLEILRALARIYRESVPDVGDDVYAYMGRFVAASDLASIYANLLHPGEISRTLGRALLMWKIYHDTGTFHVTAIGADRARLELVDYGLPSLEMCGVLRGFIEEAARLGGAKKASATEVACRNHGAASCVWELWYEQ
jgi:hypothetical protein